MSNKLARAGDSDILRSLAKDLIREVSPATAEPQAAPDSQDLAFMARELVQCTLPHSDPGQIPFWTRVNGNITLSVMSDYDPFTGQLIGYPYGSIPRLLLFWMTTEALRKGSRRLELGSSYGAFLRTIGLDPATGRGVRGDAQRVRRQTRRLFTSRISFIHTAQVQERVNESRLHMEVTSQSSLWWDPHKPDQINLWGSWIELGEQFYAAITAAPVPVDLRALKALKRSPLALDLYAWSTHKAFAVSRKGKAQFVPWRGLAKQFGSEYANPMDFKRKAIYALQKIQAVYPGLCIEQVQGGINVLASSTPAIPSAPSAI